MKIKSLSLVVTAIVSTLMGCSFLTHQNYPNIRLGASQSQIKEAIGQNGSEVTHPIDHQQDLKVSAGFDNGVCDRIKYTSAHHQKISDKTVSGILPSNSMGSPWRITGKSESPVRVYYRSLDGKYRAVLTDGIELFVVTNALFEKTDREISQENKDHTKGTKN
jgi:hypothetical protein